MVIFRTPRTSNTAKTDTTSKHRKARLFLAKQVVETKTVHVTAAGMRRAWWPRRGATGAKRTPEQPEMPPKKLVIVS